MGVLEFYGGCRAADSNCAVEERNMIGISIAPSTLEKNKVI